MAAAELRHRATDLFSDWRWRVNNLYHITDKDGRRVKFETNSAQEQLLADLHYMNAILKARQLGFTTLIQLLMLDACVFNSNIRAGTIAHTLTDAQAIFRDKVRYPYENLPEGIRQVVYPRNENASELSLSNNSSIRVSTSHRSGTLNYLHVSEYGKLCAKFPEKAREVRTGALNTVQAGNMVFVESTAEGQQGDYYEICQRAQAAERMGAKLTPLDFKFHFRPWWKAPEYRIDPEGVPIPEDMARYFAKLAEANGITLDAGQKAWYVKKAASQLGDMKREYPSTPKEAFEAAVEGAYYGPWMEAAETQGRIGTFKAEPRVPVHTAWDIGRKAYTSIWFWQQIGSRVRLVGFYQNCDNGLPHYVEMVRKMYAEHGWTRAERSTDFVPHDIRVREWGSDKSRIEQMFAHKMNPQIATELSIEDGIEAVRKVLPLCEFDEEGCAEGIKVLKNYRHEWDDIKGVWKNTPFQDDNAHGADAFRYLAAAHRDMKAPKPEQPKPAAVPVPQTTARDLLRTHSPRRVWE